MDLPRQKLHVRFAEAGDAEAIRRFNARLDAGGIGFRLPVSLVETPAGSKGSSLPRRLMIAEDGAEVRAGIQLNPRKIIIHGQERDFCWAQLPISEGLINRAYSLAIVSLVKSGLALQPFLLGLGLGSLDAPWARFLLGMRWRHDAVPFLFFPVHGTRVLLGLSYLKRNRKLHLASRLAAYGGLGLGLGGFQALRRHLSRAPACESWEEAGFGDWANAVFQDGLADYGAVVRRDAASLNNLYPPSDPRVVRLRVRRPGSGQDLGWIVVIHARMRPQDPGYQYFGNLRVGTLVDGFGRAEHVPALIAAGLDHLVRTGVDLVVTNWSHHAWVNASRRLGFRTFRSNYYFFVAPAGAPLLEASCPLQGIHMTRGDCDGPGHLLPPLEG
jgi:hypothetical protein